MNAAAPPATREWVTSCHGDDTLGAPVHTAALCEHLALCTRQGLRWPLAAVLVDTVQRFVSARLVTTAAMGLVVLGTTSWLLWF
jgi:hypothetical protein